MNYQGLLLTGAGTPITAPTDVEFRIWDSPSNTDGLKWGRSFRVTPDTNGVFNVVLSGEGTLLLNAPDVSLSSVFRGTNADMRYLELTVAGGTAIRPRQQFLTAPYSFESFGCVPIGGIIMWSGATNNIPEGWVLCAGGTTNGLVIPDLSGRFVLGAGQGAGLTAREVGDLGGEESHILTLNEMPAYTHYTTFVDNGYPDNWGRRDGTFVNGHFIVDPHGGGNLANFTNSPAGSDGAHINMPPYYVLAYIMRVK